MSKEYTDNDKMTDEERAIVARVFLKETNWMLDKLVKKYPEIKELSQMLLLMGGNTVIFDGWGQLDDLSDLLYNGKIVEVEDVSLDLAKGKDCPVGFCWSNTATFVLENPNLIPVYAFALNSHYKTFSFWMEHFIVKDKNTGKYYEATDIDSIIKYYVIDITFDKMSDMESEYFEFEIDE
jgi:hypothetical protein